MRKRHEIRDFNTPRRSQRLRRTGETTPNRGYDERYGLFSQAEFAYDVMSNFSPILQEIHPIHFKNLVDFVKRKGLTHIKEEEVI